jgi:hypothetical protein
MAVPTREQYFETWLTDFYFPERYKIVKPRYENLDPVFASAATLKKKYPETYRAQAETAREWILRGRYAGGVTGVGPNAPQELLRPVFEKSYQELVAKDAAEQEKQLQAQQAAAEKAAKDLAAEQARIQAQLKAEQQAIIQQQQKQTAAIEAQLARERKAAQTEQARLKTQFEAERQQTERLIGEAQVETERQQIAGKREAALALNVGKQASIEELRKQQAAAAPVRLPQEQRKRTMIGQPGVSATRFSARSGVGGYGGTAAGRINPTGLNI